MILGYIVRLKIKEIKIWNLSKVILSKLNFSIHCFNCYFNSAKKTLLNEIVIISNREVFDYGYRDSTNGKNIINFIINRDRQGKVQTNKKNFNIIDTKEF